MKEKQTTKTCKAADSKKKVVQQIIDNAKKYPIIGILNMEGLPASSLLQMKKQLRGKVELVMTRKTLIIRGLEQLKLTNGDQLITSIKGMPAVMFTKENPFALYKILKKSKTPAAAKAGQTAPRDIELKAGPTPFTPGPVISEFAQLGIKAGVEAGKVAIKENKIVVKEGGVISDKLASMLQRLGIEPMEIGLDLVCVYEKGLIYAKSILDVDETQFMAQLCQATRCAFNIAIDTGYTTKDTIDALITKAHREAREIGMQGKIVTPEITEELAKAQTGEVATEGNVQIQ